MACQESAALVRKRLKDLIYESNDAPRCLWRKILLQSVMSRSSVEPQYSTDEIEKIFLLRIFLEDFLNSTPRMKYPRRQVTPINSTADKFPEAVFKHGCRLPD